jgi:hypothetical protein
MLQSVEMLRVRLGHRFLRVECAKVSETTGAVIRDIQASGIQTLAGIARSLQARGIKTPAGRHEWQPVQVSRLLAA